MTSDAARRDRERPARPTGVAALFFSSRVEPVEVELPRPALPRRIGPLLADGDGRFELVGEIAPGRQATVYRAIDRSLSDAIVQLDVAVKLFPKPSDAGGRDPALVEGRFMRLARDPNVVTVLDAGTTKEGWPFLVLAMIDAVDLRAWRTSKSTRVDQRRAATIARDVAIGLAAVHTAQLVHCDVSPQNILVDRHDRSILADFGCAARTRPLLEEAEVTGGTPGFMPGEQWNGAQPDDRTDIAGLGGVLYWLLTEEPPYGATEDAMRAAHANPAEADARRRRSLAAARVDPDLVALLRSMLDANPEARPAASDVVQRLNAWLARARRIRLRGVVLAVLISIALTGAAMWALRPVPDIKSFSTEYDSLASALGVSQSDRLVAVLAARGRTPSASPPSAEEELAAIEELAARFGTIARDTPVRRFTLATLGASLALEHEDLESADRWLPMAEAALNAPEFAPLVAADEAWLRRQRGLVAVAHMIRRSPHAAAASTGADSVPSVAEMLRVGDWLDLGTRAWRAPNGAETTTSRMLSDWRRRLRERYPIDGPE